MKRVLACVLFGALLASAQAEDATPHVTPAEARPALEVPSALKGYAVDQPEILLRQRLFGLAHGLSLLAAACLDLPAYSGPVQNAYATWHAQQGKTIRTIVHDLARHYFGSRADEARWPDLSRALNLADSIQPALREVTLHAACASLPEAISRPRYALDKLLAGSVEAEDIVAAPPAPTFEKPAK